ncbi:hypothetical protein HNR42_002115 [Deinobacterium chartae]|uniref:ATP-grasp domain-containing protein n=1 Tax=Deinobacterium chartae TaxID=521158 RepID=A0A841I2P7_9DEIO|nr:hypothetical protein [Deinobacterium chartae]MBB6098680.1 hypothetical protein [Deinobacterium chartae]
MRPLRVLLTGGRAPATLELARLLHAAGCEVISAESAPCDLAGASRAVARRYRLPPPRWASSAFAAELARIALLERADLIVPTCEEIFWVARFRSDLEAVCPVACEPLGVLEELHDKERFVRLAAGLGLEVPETRPLRGPEDLRALGDPREWVLKPTHSRFAARTRLRPSPAALRRWQPLPGERWVAQRYLRGRVLCSYSVAREGRLCAHACYAATLTAGAGASVVFRAERHAAVRAWVERFVAARRFSGQIAFDFVEGVDGRVAAIECNPRLTSGIHLFAGQAQVVEGLLGREAGEAGVLEPDGNCAYALHTALLLRLLGRPACGDLWRALRQSRDVIARPGDAVPARAQLRSAAWLLALGWRRGISPLEASTWDIEYNGSRV